MGDYLAHHGVKGMRWGIRHDRELKRRVRQTKNLAKYMYGTAKLNANQTRRVMLGYTGNAAKVSNNIYKKIVPQEYLNKLNKIERKINPISNANSNQIKSIAKYAKGTLELNANQTRRVMLGYTGNGAKMVANGAKKVNGIIKKIGNKSISDYRQED